MRFNHSMCPAMAAYSTNFPCGPHAKFTTATGWLLPICGPVTRRRIAMHPEYLPARIALVANGLSMIVLYPLNMLVLERASWV
jgi:hypothetical protein